MYQVFSHHSGTEMQKNTRERNNIYNRNRLKKEMDAVTHVQKLK